MAHVLPTGRNFFSVDPKALPTPLAWDVGRRLADELVARHVAEDGTVPATVGLVIWGTAAMRTQGDDVAEALALLGVRPRWHDESARVAGIDAIPPSALGRPRIEVVVRISGFFRDAFPNLVQLIDDAAALVAGIDEPPASNPVRAHTDDDPRVFGPAPGGYGSGILPLLESGDWSTDDDPPAPASAWGGATPTGARGMASRPTTPCAVASPPSTSRSRTRTTANTTSSTPTIISRTMAGWWRPCARSPAPTRRRGSATRPTRPGRACAH